jgi:hypothetical protein
MARLIAQANSGLVGRGSQATQALVTTWIRANPKFRCLRIVADRPPSVYGDCDPQVFRRQATKEIECSDRFLINRLVLGTNFSRLPVLPRCSVLWAYPYRATGAHKRERSNGSVSALQARPVSKPGMSKQVNVSVSVNVPDELDEEGRSIAEAEGVSVEGVVASALACHFAAWRRLRERASRSDRHQFLAVLEKVKDIEPEEYDRL